MYKIATTNRFEKDIIRCIRRNWDITILEVVVQALEQNGVMDEQYKPHPLKGSLKDYWECHIKGDWLLIWSRNDVKKEIVLIRTGTHSDLF